MNQSVSRVADHLSDTLKRPIAYDGTATWVKTVLFLIVCAAWLFPGLIGHDPWKPDEAVTFAPVHHMLASGDWIVPMLAGEPFLERGPLYFWVAAITSKLTGWLLAPHDAARIATGAFMATTLAFVSFSARRLSGDRGERIGVLLFIGCIGLLIRAHEMNSDLAALAGVAIGFYGFVMARERPRAGGAWLGVGIATAFLGDGTLPALLLASLAAALPALLPTSRTRNYASTCITAAACAVPLMAFWPLLLFQVAPQLPGQWLVAASGLRAPFVESRSFLDGPGYFLRILPWHAWPAWPLAAWAVWRARRHLPERDDLRLPLVAFATFLAVLTLVGEARDVNALPMLVPLTMLAVAEIDSLPRGAASALDWFGVTTFFLFGAVLWVGWYAVLTGTPEGAAQWVRKEIPGFSYGFHPVSVALAAALSLVWVVVVARSLRNNRRAIVNWAAGITMVWMLAMALGLPLIDQARSYRGMFASMQAALPAGHNCIAASGMGDPQRALLDYFTGLRTIRAANAGAQECDLLLVQGPAANSAAPPAGFAEIWRGTRPGDRAELFRLYRRATL
jgi:4-amino-4-deoxy-L-arabinose transferase-like glycosyltransferase